MQFFKSRPHHLPWQLLLFETILSEWLKSKLRKYEFQTLLWNAIWNPNSQKFRFQEFGLQTFAVVLFIYCMCLWFQHTMWQAWDLAVDMALSQLPSILDNDTPYRASTFFEEQLTAFEVWLKYGNEKRPPPEQLPIVLQVCSYYIH